MADLSLRLPAVPENVIVVRELLRGIDGVLTRPGLSEAVLTAVSEAANNVVMHAYDGVVGPLEVSVSLDAGLQISVRDWGAGFPDADGEDSGFGREVITAFADDVEVWSQAGAGSEVRLRWEMPPLIAPAVGEAGSPLQGEIVMTLRPDPAFKLAVVRVLSALGARARLTVSRLGDLRMLGDVLVGEAGPQLTGHSLSLVFLQRGRGLQISVGPLREQGADALRHARTVDGRSVVDRLTNDVEVLHDPATGHEVLVLTVLDDG